MKKPKRRISKRSIVLLLSLLLLVGVTCGGTLAYLAARTDPLENEFQPNQVKTKVVETFDAKVKSNVKVKNTGTTSAWIRAAIIVTWQDESGNVYGQAPVLDTDYTLTFASDSGWTKGNDGFYYYTSPVAAEAETGVLISEAKPVAGKAPDGYVLSIEIVCSGLQSVPDSVFDSNWGASSGLEVKDGTLQVKGGS